MTFAVRSSWSTGGSGPTPVGLVLQYDMTGVLDPAYNWDDVSGFTGSPTVTFSVDNDTLTWSPTTASTSVYVATGTGITTGKVYCEFACTANTGNMPLGFGVQSVDIDQFYQPNGASIFAGAGGCGLGTQGLYLGATLVSSAAGYSFTVGDRIGIAFDADTQDVWFSKNGTWVVGDPATGTSPSTTLTNPDADIASVTLLLHMNGVNGSTTFTDTSSYGTTITAVSGAQISTAQSEFGGASGLFVFANADYITAPASNQFRFPGDFTVECWIRPTTLTVTASFAGKVIFDTRASVNSPGIVAYVKFGVLNFYTGGVNVAGSIAFVADDWIHVAITRSGSSIQMWQGGVQTGSTSTNTTNFSDGLLAVGGESWTNQSWFDGYIDEFRITNGVARYTATFTPPTVQFPNASFGVAPFYFTSGQYACATTGGTHSQQVYPTAASQTYAAPSGFTVYNPNSGLTVSISLDEYSPVPITAPLALTIDWGDGAFLTYTTAGTYSHTYTAVGEYIVSLAGVCSAVDTLGQNELQGINSWTAFLGLQFLNLSTYGANNLYVPDNLPSTLRSVRISGFFNDSSVSSWDTSNLTDMSYMFQGATGLNQPIGSWDTSAVTTMRAMFSGIAAFNQDISAWDTSSVTTMREMFSGATAFNQPLNSWDTSSVDNMFGTFSGASAFDQPLADWSTGAVTDMAFMFSNATVFDQDISLWCVYQILSEPSSFNTSGVLTPAYFPVWGECPVVIPFPLTFSNGGDTVFTGKSGGLAFPLTLTR